MEHSLYIVILESLSESTDFMYFVFHNRHSQVCGAEHCQLLS